MKHSWRLCRTAAGGISLAISLTLCSCGAEAIPGKCVGVFDGDTISVIRDGRAVKIRLEGIDSPEWNQPFGNKAKQFMSSLAFQKIVEVREMYKDTFGRPVARVIADGRDLSLEIVREGFAWHFTRYSKDAKLAAAEKEARQAKKGLWADPHPVPPWEFRRTRNKNRKD